MTKNDEIREAIERCKRSKVVYEAIVKHSKSDTRKYEECIKEIDEEIARLEKKLS